MLFPSSRSHRIPPSTIDSQYDTPGYSSSSYTKWPRPTAKPDLYTVRNVGPTGNSSSQQYSSTRGRNNHVNEPLSNILNYQFSQSDHQQQRPQQQPIYSTISPQRPTINYLLP